MVPSADFPNQLRFLIHSKDFAVTKEIQVEAIGTSIMRSLDRLCSGGENVLSEGETCYVFLPGNTVLQIMLGSKKNSLVLQSRLISIQKNKGSVSSLFTFFVVQFR